MPEEPNRSGGQDGHDATRATAPDAGHTPAPPTRAADATLPARLGRYEIVRVLGRGGMGIVYEARQESPRRTVALKVIRAGTMSPDLLRRFGQESQVLGRLQHPGIAQVYEAGTVSDERGEDVPFFAMEFIKGVSLTDFVAARRLGTRERLGLVAKVCDAVDHAHQKGVIHRDLKPGNVLVDESGQPKILDFGVARATDSDIQQTTMRTDIGQLIGTVSYMSPEQVSGDPKELDTRSDVYALGVVAYELLTGKLPHDLSKAMLHEAVRAIREEEPTRLSVINRTLRGDVETLVAKALEKDKNRRYQSAAAFATDIRRFLDDQPIEARPASTWYQTVKFARRNRGLVAGLGAAFVCLVVGLVFSLVSRNQAVAEREAAEGFVTLMVDKVRDKYAEVGRLDALADVAGSVQDYYARRGESSLGPEQLLLFAKAMQLSGEAAMGSGNLGAAKGSFAEERRLLADLVTRHPGEGRFIKALGAAHFYLGDIARRSGDLATAEKEWTAYLDAAERLVALDAANPEWQMELAYAHANFIPLNEDRGNFAAARTALKKTLDIKRRLVALDPAKAEYRRGLANSLTQLATAEDRAGNTDAAIAAATEAVRTLSAEDPRDADGQHRLAASYANVARLFQRTGRHAEALASSRAMLDVVRRLIELDPSNGNWQQQMAIGHLFAARALIATGDGEGARLDLAASRRLLEALVARDPKNIRWRRDLVGTEREAARMAFLEQRWAEAAECVVRARTALEGGESHADSAEARADLWVQRAALDVAEGRIRAASGDSAGGRELWSDVVARLEPVAIANGDDEVLDTLAQALLLLDRPADAAVHVQRLRASGALPSDEVAALLNKTANK